VAGLLPPPFCCAHSVSTCPDSSYVQDGVYDGCEAMAEHGSASRPAL
jgi:hypothetical protein